MGSKASKRMVFKSDLAATGNNTGVLVPPEVIEGLGSGKRPAVMVDLNGYQYRSTVGVMDGRAMISVSAAVRKATGLKGGDAVTVTLSLEDGPREVIIPKDFGAALSEYPNAKKFFGALSNSLQRYHVDNINGAKSPGTRQRRIDKSIELFLEGKQR